MPEPEPQVVFISPEAVLGALTPKPKATLEPNLGPSGPHVFEDDESVEIPMKPPTVGAVAGEASKHYTNVLDELWPEFDDAEERTAGRLRSLLEEVADEAQRVFILAQELWGRWSTQFKIPESERNRWDKEFTAYLRRLNGYRTILDELDDASTATGDVYVGLVRRRQGAGPVPDAIMHMYFANQIGILAEHAEDMSVGFIGRVLDVLPVIKHYAEQAGDAVSEAAEDAAEGAGEAAGGAFDRVMRPWLIAGGVLSALTVGVLGVVVVDRLRGGKG